MPQPIQMCVWILGRVFLVPGGAGKTASVWLSTRQPVCLPPLIFYSLLIVSRKEKERLWYEKNKNKNKWAIGFSLIPYPLILCLHHAGSKWWKGKKRFQSSSVCLCVCVHVRVSPSEYNINCISITAGWFPVKGKLWRQQGRHFQSLEVCYYFVHFNWKRRKTGRLCWSSWPNEIVHPWKCNVALC